MVKGMIGIKRGMTTLFDEETKMAVPVTVVEVGPCWVVQNKTPEQDGYRAVQLGFLPITKKKIRMDVRKRFEKLGIQPLKVLREFPVEGDELPEVGSKVTVSIFKDVKKVNVVGISKGKGFQGVMRRHGAHGGGAAHGSKFHRAPGSIGNCAYPAEVRKGAPLPGRTGGRRVTVKGLQVVRVDEERNLLFVKGAVPGHRKGFVYLYKAQ